MLNKAFGCKWLTRFCYLDCCSVTQSWLTLCDPINCSTPGFLVLHHHIHWVSDAIQSSHPLSSCPQSFPASRSSPWSWLFASGGQSIGTSASALVLPLIIQGWFPLRLTGLISCCLRDSQKSSTSPQFDSINSSALCLLYGPALTTTRDYWIDHSLDYTDLCWQSDVFAF